MEAVKMESNFEMAETIRAVVKSGVPVMGHIGLTPQRITNFGGFKVQGRTVEGVKQILKDALALQEAGCFALVIEAVPENVGKFITERLTIPTFGIGAGIHTSGQVLVYHDVLGLYPQMSPKFSKQFVNLKQLIVDALKNYKDQVENREFPSPNHVYKMKPEEMEKLKEME
jgi:3-methyl-2-oxobutanoate hydroxymethyltransferase